MVVVSWVIAKVINLVVKVFVAVLSFPKVKSLLLYLMKKRQPKKKIEVKKNHLKELLDDI